MQIQISAGDTFHYTTPDFILTALVGQTITYGTGKDNVQVVTNGLEDSVDIDQIRPEAFSTRFIQDVFGALQVDDPAVVDAAIDAFGFEAERLFAEVLADNSAIEEVIAALNEIVVIDGLVEAAAEAADALQAEDDSLDIVAILGLADQIYQDLGTGTDFSISIDSGDSFDFTVGETTVTKLLGQTVSHVSGDDNRQTIINGFDNDATGSGGSSGGNSAAATAASTAEAASSQAGFSIVIDTGDDFTFDIGETSVVKMFGQTVSYISGDDNDQTVTNGPAILGGSSESQSSTDDVSNVSQAAATEVEAELPNVLITTGDSFSFDLGTTSITKMFGQTVSYVAGDHNVQTVTNGISVDTDPTVSSASATLEDPQPSVEELFGSSVANSESSGGTDPDKIIEILTKVADIVGKLEDPTDVSIVIETGHNFFFNIGEAEVTKMFGQTVSYVAGNRNDQTVTNGFDVTDDGDGQFSDFGNIDFAAMDIDDTQQAQALASEFGAEAEQLLDDILTDGSAIAEVVAALDDIFSQSDLGSISDLIDERQNDDDSTDMVAILELVRQIRNDLAAGSELSILIESGDDFEFNIESTSVTKMFGQTVSYVNGSYNQQTVVDGFEVTTGDASKSTTDSSLTSPGAAASQIDESTEDEADDGFSIVIDAGDNFVFNVGTADIVKMFGQTVSYAAGTNITQSVINGFSADLDGSTAGLQEQDHETRMDEAVVFPIEDAQDEDDTPNILIEANDTYTFDVDDVEIVKMFGQTVSYASGRDITQDVGNGFEAGDDTSDSSDVSFWSDESGTDSSSIEFGEDDTSNSDRAIEALTLVAELIGDAEDPSEFSVAIQSGNDFGFDVAEADVVKLYGQTVSRADGTDGTQDVEDGPVADPGGHFVSDIDSPCLGLVYRMYVASLGRTPDEEGLRYWIDILEDLKANTPGFDAADYMANRFIEAYEFEMLYGANPTDAEYVEALYWNVLERASDAAGHDYWVGRMEAGLGFDDMLVSFVQSDEAIANISPDYEDDVWVL